MLRSFHSRFRPVNEASSPHPDSPTGGGGKNLTTLAFERVREDIICCRLRPNDKLRINLMAQQYEVGATAVREALSRLVTEGLVEAVDQKGFRVARVSREDLADLTTTRIEVEQLALGKAIGIGSVDWEAAVLAAYHRLSRRVPDSLEHSSAAEWRDWRQLHRQFHEVLVEGCGSRWLRYLCGLLYDRSERYRNLAGLAAGKVKPVRRDVMAEHKALVDAVLARDATKAQQLLAEHLEETSRGVLRASEAAPSMFAEGRRQIEPCEEPAPKAKRVQRALGKAGASA